MKILIILFTLISLNGCAGFVNSTSSKTTVCSYFCLDYNFSDHPSKEKIISSFGKPNKIIDNNKTEILIYKERRWIGFTPILIIPIPFIFPLREDSYEFIYAKNIFVGMKKTETIDNVNLCSFFPLEQEPSHNIYCLLYESPREFNLKNK